MFRSFYIFGALLAFLYSVSVQAVELKDRSAVCETLPGIQCMELKFKQGDSLHSLLTKSGVSNGNVGNLAHVMKGKFDAKKLPVGSTMFAVIKREEGEGAKVEQLELRLVNGRIIRIVAQESGGYFVEFLKQAANVELVRVVGETLLNSSLAQSALQQGVSPLVVSRFEKLYSGVVNFKRDVHPGTQFEILFERFFDDEGRHLYDGKIIYSSLKTKHHDKQYYLFEGDKECRNCYFDAQGGGIHGASFAMPIRAKFRISSGYGMRKHPITGDYKMHKGVDFAVPKNTEIYASGAGVVDQIGYSPTYGNYIRINHGGAQTLYAHLEKFSKDLSKGRRVKAKQLIGYVGKTGSATGYHLHYEVLEKGRDGRLRPTNPMPKLEHGAAVTQCADIQAFKKQVQLVDRMRAMAAV